MARTLPISEVKTHLPELLTGVEEREEEIVVTRKGRPAAVLVNFAEYERLKATIDVLSDRALMRQIQRSQSQSAGFQCVAMTADAVLLNQRSSGLNRHYWWRGGRGRSRGWPKRRTLRQLLFGKNNNEQNARAHDAHAALGHDFRLQLKFFVKKQIPLGLYHSSGSGQTFFAGVKAPLTICHVAGSQPRASSVENAAAAAFHCPTFAYSMPTR